MTQTAGNLLIAALTPAGAALGRRLAAAWPGSRLHLPPKLQDHYPEAVSTADLRELFALAFREKKPLVCIMAVGIVVRLLAPLVRHKAQDPAVVVADEAGRFVISLLSGHLGGANHLARKIAQLLGATPVITTATDVHDLPAFDALAAEHGWKLANLAAVKAVHAALLAGELVPVLDEDDYLPSLLPAEHLQRFRLLSPSAPEPLPPGPAVYLGFREYDWPPHWLRLRPPRLIVGLGCNRGASPEEILELITTVFRQQRLAVAAIGALATIDLKKEEPGLLATARHLGVKLLCYTSDELQGVPVPHPSALVQQHVGVPSVCEAAALTAARTDRLLVPKQKSVNVTLAVAAAGWP